jgi:hypothetical protein
MKVSEVLCLSAEHCQLYVDLSGVGAASGTGILFIYRVLTKWTDFIIMNKLLIMIPIFVCKRNCIDTVTQLGVQFVRKYTGHLLMNYKNPTYCRKAYSKVYCEMCRPLLTGILDNIVLLEMYVYRKFLLFPMDNKLHYEKTCLILYSLHKVSLYITPYKKSKCPYYKSQQQKRLL